MKFSEKLNVHQFTFRLMNVLCKSTPDSQDVAYLEALLDG